MGLIFFLAPQIVWSDPAPISQKEYVRRAHSQINAFTHQLHEVESKAEKLDASTRAECQKTLQQIRRKERLARVQLETIRKAPSDQWRQLRKEEDTLLVHLQKSYQHLKNEYFR